MCMVSLQQKLTNNIISRERPHEKGTFLKRVGTLLKEGYSIKDALIFLEKIEKNVSKTWVKAIQEGLNSGSSLHEELEKVGFSTKICAQIYLAYQYGNYAETITRSGEQLLAELEQEKKFRSLLAYPLLLILFLVGMLLLMRFLILPHMEVLFSTSHSDVDIYSNWIVAFIYYSPQIILCFLLISFLIYLFVKKRLEKRTLVERYRLFMNYPIIHLYLKDYWTHFFFFEWGNLFKNGCSFQEIITIMQEKEASKLLQETGQILEEEMKVGKNLHESLATLPFFHEEALLVVHHGENLGKLSTEMLVYASYCETEFQTRIEKLMTKIQPVIFCLIALMIIAIYASLMLPIFSLMEGF